MTSFNRVATDRLQASIHGLRQQNPIWEAFEEELKRTFAIEDSSKATRRGFEEWVETPGKVIMFLRAVDVRDRKDLGVLLKDTTTESGLTETWESM